MSSAQRPARKLILRNFQSPGDVLMLTAAVRDLHRCYPGRFVTDVRTHVPDLWKHNPHLTPLKESDPDVSVIDCKYPLIQSSNRAPHHFIEGFVDFLNSQLGLNIRLTAFHGDIHLSPREKAAPSIPARLVGKAVPYWILVAGGKFDYTIKWWHFRRFQEVVDRFKDRILFVQVGQAGHFHPDLHGVLDLRGRTSIRELIRLVYHAQGVLCPVTFLMHLAAAVETRPDAPPARPCVVIAGGREPPQWEAYPPHQFIHTIGALPCCATGGCWRSRTVPLGDGDEKDSRDSLCLHTVDRLPACMDLITPEEVARRIELYFQGGMSEWLTPEDAACTRPFLRTGLRARLMG